MHPGAHALVERRRGSYTNLQYESLLLDRQLRYRSDSESSAREKAEAHASHDRHACPPAFNRGIDSCQTRPVNSNLVKINVE